MLDEAMHLTSFHVHCTCPTALTPQLTQGLLSCCADPPFKMLTLSTSVTRPSCKALRASRPAVTRVHCPVNSRQLLQRRIVVAAAASDSDNLPRSDDRGVADNSGLKDGLKEQQVCIDVGAMRVWASCTVSAVQQLCALSSRH